MKEEIVWVPVAERIPNDARDVLVFQSEWNRVAVGFYADKLWFWKGSSETMEDVTHWAELPKGPKEKV